MMPCKTSVFLLILISVFLLVACAGTSTTPERNYTWNMKINEAEIKENLITTEVVTLYNGEKDEVIHENYSESGNVFLLLSLDINKGNTEGGSFEWQNLKVLDESGASFNRLENDSFLELHGFIPRMTGLSIRFGENSGWVCFEIPQEAAKGKLFLVYSNAEEEQKLEIKH
jgi:hypothetical protein